MDFRRHGKEQAVKVEVEFPSHERIKACCKELVFEIGLPPDLGGDPEAYGPFDLVLSALALCTGHQVRTFLMERDLPIDDAGVILRAERGADSHLLDTVSMEIRVPKEFPEKYNDAIVRAAGQCLVKAQLGQKPDYDMSVVRV
jgi:ribosomal protein S12 methylthiotransferase accessory factor